MIFEKKNNLQTAQEWTKYYIELIASYVHPKNSNHLLSHLKAIMALDHCRIIRPGKKFGPNFVRSTSLLYKILPTNLGACKNLLYHLYITSEVKQYYEVLFLSYRPRTECSIQSTYFTILQYKLHSFNIQNDRSKRWLLAKPLKNCQNHLYCQPRFSLLQCEL